MKCKMKCLLHFQEIKHDMTLSTVWILTKLQLMYRFIHYNFINMFLNTIIIMQFFFIVAKGQLLYCIRRHYVRDICWYIVVG